jgi:hypothetical protein
MMYLLAGQIGDEVGHKALQLDLEGNLGRAAAAHDVSLHFPS